MLQGIKIIKAVFKAINKVYDQQEDQQAKRELREIHEKTHGGKTPSSRVANAKQDEEEDTKSVYSDVKSDIFNDNQQKLLIQINEWFTLIFMMLAHNRNAKDLAKTDSDDEEEDDDDEDEISASEPS